MCVFVFVCHGWQVHRQIRGRGRGRISTDEVEKYTALHSPAIYLEFHSRELVIFKWYAVILSYFINRTILQVWKDCAAIRECV